MRFCQINRGREKSNEEKGMLKNNGFRDRRSFISGYLTQLRSIAILQVITEKI